jgi:hypothetical protein
MMILMGRVGKSWAGAFAHTASEMTARIETMKNGGTTSLHFLCFVEDRPTAIAAQSGRQHICDRIELLACGLALPPRRQAGKPVLSHAPLRQ